jgi:hypothetical protein
MYISKGREERERGGEGRGEKGEGEIELQKISMHTSF